MDNIKGKWISLRWTNTVKSLFKVPCREVGLNTWWKNLKWNKFNAEIPDLWSLKMNIKCVKTINWGRLDFSANFHLPTLLQNSLKYTETNISLAKLPSCKFRRKGDYIRLWFGNIIYVPLNSSICKNYELDENDQVISLSQGSFRTKWIHSFEFSEKTYTLNLHFKFLRGMLGLIMKLNIFNQNYWILHMKQGKPITVTGQWGLYEWDAEDPTFSRQAAHIWLWCCQLHALYPTEKFLVLISVGRWVNPRATERLEGLDKRDENPMTPSGIKRTNFWLAAWCLNQLKPATDYILLTHSTAAIPILLYWMI
jgi:hypothetical protein